MRRAASRESSGDRFQVIVAVCKEAIGWLGIPGSLSDQEGFIRWVDDSVVLIGDFDRWANRLFKKKRLALAFAQHAREANKRMPDSNWHNPLVNALLD